MRKNLITITALAVAILASSAHAGEVIRSANGTFPFSAQQPTPILPDPKLTPGDVFDVTLQDICTPGYSKNVRAVPTHLKKQAYARYGITSWKPGDYEVDHLIRYRSVARTRSGTSGRNRLAPHRGTPM